MIALPPPLAPLSRLLRPFAPAWVQDAWPRAAQSRLKHCLVLALLLHVWLVLMLGNAPPGTALPGQGVWGALNVTLRGVAQGVPATAPTPPLPAAPAGGPPGGATSPRSGGTVRDAQALSLPEPGAVRRGDWAATPAPLAELQAALPTRPEPVRLPEPAAAAPLPAPEPLAAPAMPAEPAPVLRQVAPLPAATPSPVMAPLQTLPAAQAAVGLPSLPAAPAGMPLATLPAAGRDAGPQVGHDVATAPSAPASTPRLNLDLVRPRGGELSRQGGAGVLPLLPRPPELPDKLARDIEKAGKADCRKAYQGLGVLAVVPLAADALRGSKDGACRW